MTFTQAEPSKPTKTKRKTLGDFAPVINNWHGGWRLLGVGWPQRGPKVINLVICRVVCAKGHEGRIQWQKLRDERKRPKCAQCDSAATERRLRVVTRRRKAKFEHLTGPRLTEAIGKLTPERLRLFEALMDSRRRAPGDDEFEFEEYRYDAWAYASQVPDPLEDLRELNAPSHPRQEISTAYYAMHFIGE